MKNKKVIIIFITFVVIICIAIGIFMINRNKKVDNDDVSTNKINKIVVLESDDSAKAAELVKKNVVKVTNEIDDNTKIIGTGFFHESGYLVTNSHIVDIEGKVNAHFSNGEVKEAKLVSNDITSDIAILSVDKVNVLAMTFGNTLKLNVTDEVYGIGYAYALEGEASVSKGILSARRSAGGIEFLQSDISLNTGNSGGPLINAKGEFLGINTYATENASISMAISSESLETIISKLINEKKVNYLDKERDTNALSVVLKEIGHEVEDIYNEDEIIKHKFHKNEEEKHDNKHEDNNVPSGNVPSGNGGSVGHSGNDVVDMSKSSNSKLASLSVDGYPINFNPDTLTYCALLRNKNVSSLKINAVAQESESKITIKNNKIEQGKGNQISIEVIAPNNRNGHTYDIFALSTKDILEPARLNKIAVSNNLDYVASKGGNYYKIYWNYMDRDGVLINMDSNNITSIVSNYTVEVSVNTIKNTYNDDGMDVVNNTRVLKTYKFNGTGIDGETYYSQCGDIREKAYISIDEIRSMLTDDDYGNTPEDQTHIIFNVTVNTYHQGSFTGSTMASINK